MCTSPTALGILRGAFITGERAHKIVESRVQTLTCEANEALDECERVAAVHDDSAKDRLLRWAKSFDRYRDRVRRLGRWTGGADEAAKSIETQCR